MSSDRDRLFRLMPPVYQDKDAGVGYPLRALLRVIAEQVEVVENNIADTYDNWFIETCADWVIPYLGDLIGYQPVHARGDPSGPEPAADEGAIILEPRREVANTMRFRRRKGTLRVLEDLARAVTDWPALAVEFSRRLGMTQPLTRPGKPLPSRLVDLRDGDALARLGTPFDTIAHRPDVHGLAARHGRGRFNLPEVGVFVWRLKAYHVSQMLAHALEDEAPAGRPRAARYTFSILGNDVQLYTAPRELPEGTPPTELDLPTPIRRRAFEQRDAKHPHRPGCASPQYYGSGRSILIWSDHRNQNRRDPPKLLPADAVIPADLSDWGYAPPHGRVAVDPVLGRLAFPHDQAPRRVLVEYYYAAPMDIGGGEYTRRRPIYEGAVTVIDQDSLEKALDKWQTDQPPNQVIEISANGVYEVRKELVMGSGQSLTLRAGANVRPVLHQTARADWPHGLTVRSGTNGAPALDSGCRLTLEGLLITGCRVRIEGGFEEVVLSHCTLTPGWSILPDGSPRHSGQPSLDLFTPGAQVKIDHCILGMIEVEHGPAPQDPCRLTLADSILDATTDTDWALRGPDCVPAHMRLTVLRSTVRGRVVVQAIDLVENSIFEASFDAKLPSLKAARQEGCVRFCYVPPGTVTPPRYECQPDMAQAQPNVTDKDQEALRVRPVFESTRYGTPTYFRLAEESANEIRTGADDESEMGVYHDLLEPQKLANLRTRLDEFTPAALQAGAILAS